MDLSNPKTITHLKADYVVYGAGAMGMAFVDELVSHTKKRIILVDKQSQPGGHWNNAYPFVRLHQPSSYFGVNSRVLEKTKHSLELASRNELLSYYEAVLQSFLASGRVKFFPMCKCDDTTSRTFRSLIEPSNVFKVSEHAKIVDATYMNVKVPSISPAHERYSIANGINVIPLNDLVHIDSSYSGNYVVIGAGKTGIDAVLWLLRAGVKPERVWWIMPRDSWMFNRDSIYPHLAFKNLFQQLETFENASTWEEWLLAQEKHGFYMRIDQNIMPKRHKCATVSEEELEILKRVSNIVRKGRVVRVEKEQIVLEKGKLETGPSTLYVDCSSDGLPPRPVVPVFNNDKITLQSIQLCNQPFSAAIIGYVEGRNNSKDSDEAKNALCIPCPHPIKVEEFFKAFWAHMRNIINWKRDSSFVSWLKNARLNFESHGPGKLEIISFFIRNITSIPRLLNANEMVEKKMGQFIDQIKTNAAIPSKL